MCDRYPVLDRLSRLSTERREIFPGLLVAGSSRASPVSQVNNRLFEPGRNCAILTHEFIRAEGSRSHVAKKQLGKYDVIERLGRGGMAEVYKAYQPSLDRFVAIKLLHPFLADDPEFKDRFEREARNVARLRHPNIVQVYDFEYDDQSESYYMVMELIEGQTLKSLLER